MAKKSIERTRGYVYFLKLQGFDVYKIGMTRGLLQDRLEGIRASMPFDFDLIACGFTGNAPSAERWFHREAARLGERLRAEWFRLSSSVAEQIASELERWRDTTEERRHLDFMSHIREAGLELNRKTIRRRSKMSKYAELAHENQRLRDALVEKVQR